MKLNRITRVKYRQKRSKDPVMRLGDEEELAKENTEVTGDLDGLSVEW